ncbi:MAG: AMP-binding protein [Acidobacteriota bacterium]|nr:MAG: AMP-binding protein [Acidobacteriota bacterium]
MSRTFCQRLVDSFETHSDRVAMRIVGTDDATYTFGESLRIMRSVAYRLDQEGVGRGDRVALIGENHPKWAICYLASIYNRSVIVPMDPHGEIETITNFIENSEAKVAFLSPDQTERFQQIEERLGRKVPAVVWQTNGEPSMNGFQRFEDWAETPFPGEYAATVPETDEKDIALLMYTSGTTGTPKGVPLTHGNIVAELAGVDPVLSITPDDRILSLLPLFHAYLQIVNLWVAATYGVEVGYLKELTPAELSDAMKRFKPTMLTTVPRLWYVFHKKIFDAIAAKPAPVRALVSGMLRTNGAMRDMFGINLGKKLFREVHEGFGGELHRAISAGSRFDADVALDFHRLGFTILQGYGLTETSGAATATYENDNRVGSVGKPMHGAEIKIEGADAEGVGEVLIRGPMVFSGYYQNPEATADSFTADGWFRSGDLGKLVDGHLYIVGRAKDVIVLSSGKNVHPEDLEVHYLKCPLVAELAVVGIADESEARAGAEKLAAVVVPDFDYLRLEKIANSKEAIRHALDNLGRELPEYQRVRDYIIRAEPLPRTATRKIKRFQLKKEIESGVIAGEARETKAWTLTDADKLRMASPTARAVESAIRNNAKDVDIVHPAMNLEIDLGLDSLARAETFAALEQAFGVEFDGEEAAAAITVDSVVALIEKHTGGEQRDVNVDLNWGKIVRDADEDLPEVRSVLKNRPLFATFAYLVMRGFYVFCKGFMRLEVHGRDNLDIASREGRAFLICPNHQSFLDPFVLTSTYRFRLFKNFFHVGASEFFEGSLMQRVAKLLYVVPVNPDTELMRAMKAGAIGLKSGRVLNIYPEGERAFDGELHEFKKGAAILATELDLPIVPVALDGLQNVWARKSWKIRPAKVKIRIGEPFYAKDILGDQLVSGDEKAYELVTAHLKSTIAGMIADLRK